ncbi:hypothetical protein KFL_001930080 [Klebsormidium nitens]|uniref:Uncharacterized protein n=1 Tax=Klebsormidium nitens TaxID=105231 RepID=A0A1Y1I0R3_KLENI|nr:hypothetical protein KFL_001930080 [Klebsormidium nitens]|eukprot:GAQ84530.1 hypothetical protein KFL_001930080 [Klebsormidium nitens]
MFSSGGRRSSLRAKTPGRTDFRTPGPSRFSVVPGGEEATPAAVPRRFMDFERPSSEARGALNEQAQGNAAAESSRVRRTLDAQQADKAQPAPFDGGMRRDGGAVDGNGPDSNAVPLRPDDGKVSDTGLAGTSRNSERSQMRDNAPGRRAMFDSPGTAILAEELHAREAARSIRVWTAVNESVGVSVDRREENTERALTAVNPSGEEEVWRRFRGAGALDEEVLVRREKEELQRQLDDVERELADYRYNLGVLILEHKKCKPQIDELEKALQRTREELQKEGRSLQLALDDVTRREDGLRASLKAERTVIADLKQSLEEMHAKLQAEEKSSRERLARAQELEAGAVKDRERSEELFEKAARDLKGAQQLEEGLKVRESELDGKLRGLAEREDDAASREKALNEGEAALNAGKRELTEKGIKLAERKRKVEGELEEERKKLGREREEEELRVEALRRSVEGEREQMQKEMQAEKEAAEHDMSTRKAEISVKEDSLAAQEKALQMSQDELERKQEDANKRDQDLDQREKLLGDEKREMLRTEADLREQQKSMNEERARLAEQESEWQRIEAKIDARVKEIDAREAAVQAFESTAESSAKELEEGAKALRERQAGLEEKEEAVQKKEEDLGKLEKQLKGRAQMLESERAALERRKGEDVLEREQAEKKAAQLEMEAAALLDKEAQLEEQTRQLASKDKDLAAREHELLLRESGTDENLRQQKEELEAQRRQAEADVAKQLQQLQGDRAKGEALLQASRAQLDKERAAMQLELQETRASLEIEFQTKMLTADAATQRAAKSEVEKRVKDLEREAEIRAEERATVRLQERLAGVDLEVERRVSAQLKERVSELEVRNREEVERRVSEGSKKGVEREVKAQVKDAVKKAKEEAKAKYDQERGAAIQKAVRDAERKAEGEKRAAIDKAVKEERSRTAGQARAVSEAEGEKSSLQNGEGLEGVSQLTEGEQAGGPKEGVPRRSWFGLGSPRRGAQPSEARENEEGERQILVDGVPPLEQIDGLLSQVGMETPPVAVNPVGSSEAAGVEGASADEVAVHAEPTPVVSAGVNGAPSPKRPKLQSKRKQPETPPEEAPEERPLKQRRIIADAGPDKPVLEEKHGGPVEALGAAVTAVGRAADTITGPFGFVLDDTDLGFVPGHTDRKAPREVSVKKPRWSLWPGFLSPRKAKAEEGGQDGAGTSPSGEEGAEKNLPGGQVEGQSSPLLENARNDGGEVGPVLMDVQQGPLPTENETPPEMDLRGDETRAAEERATRVAKTPNTRVGRAVLPTPKPARTPKPPLSAVRTSSRLRERTLSSDLKGTLEPTSATQLAGSSGKRGKSSPPGADVGPDAQSQEPPKQTERVSPLTDGTRNQAPGKSAEIAGREQRDPSPAKTPGTGPARRLQRALTAEEQAKIERIMARLEAEERAIAADEAAVGPLNARTSPDLAPEREFLNAGSADGAKTSVPEREAANADIVDGATVKGLEKVRGAPETGNSGLKKAKVAVKRRSGERAGASGKTDETLLIEAAAAKNQELPNDDPQEAPAPNPMAPGGASAAVDAAELPTVSPSPPGPTSTLPPKTPKSAFGRAFDGFRAAWGFGAGSSRGPASEGDEEGSLEGSGGVYRSQVGELRSIVGDLVEAADRDEDMEMGGPERLEFGTPEGVPFDGPEGEERGREAAQGGEGLLNTFTETVVEKSEAALREVVEKGQKAGSVIVKKAKTAAFDLNETAMELADAAVGVSASDVADDVTRSAADLADDVTALGGAVEATVGGVADELTGNIGEALADELGAVHTRDAQGKSLVETGSDLVTGALGSLQGAGAAGSSALAADPSRGAEGGARSTRGGAKVQSKKEGGNGEERRGSKRKAPESGKGKGKVTDSENEDDVGPKRGKVKRRVKQADSEDEAGLVDPRVVEFATKFRGEVEGEDTPSEGGGKRHLRAVVDPRDGEDMSAGLRRYNLRKSTLVKMHIWEPRGADFGTVSTGSEGIHTRGGASSTPRNLQRSVFGGDNPFLEDIAPGNPHSLEEIRTPRSGRHGARDDEKSGGAAGGTTADDEEADQANAGWRWLGFLGW